MSVAFRRESDEEHKEPRFELPLPAGPNLVTVRGLALIGERAAALAEAVTNADGDAREALARELRYWQTRRATANLAPLPEADEVGIGSQITFRHGGRERMVTIVGHDEADPAAGLIAFAAPLAQALMGAMAGERVAFAGVADALEIVTVSDRG